MSKSLETLEQHRAQIVEQIVQLDDVRCGSITPTQGRCGKLNCRCHQPNQPGHGPNLRLTFKVEGKTVTESLPNPAAVNKAEREIAEFRKRIKYPVRSDHLVFPAIFPSAHFMSSTRTS